MTDPAKVNVNAIKSEIREAIINQKANACPMAVRVSWHASGTFDKRDGTGGSNGATTRFTPESTDPANAGLSIIRDLLQPVHARHPEISLADLWTLAGACAVEFLGGPVIPHRLGRSDARNGATCPANGRLPDASQGAAHLRDVFHRMGMTDQEIVALSGAHTLGRCHLVRSGFDGQWTGNPLVFDNSYFKNLVELQWKVKDWTGPKQFEAVDKNGLVVMMLPTDMALMEDSIFSGFVRKYASDEKAFHVDFAAAYSKLLALGCPAMCDPTTPAGNKPLSAREAASADFREWAMHGSLEHVRRYAKDADVHAVEENSGRTALHKAAYWGHNDLVKMLLSELSLNSNIQDYNGDTPLHDASRFGHVKVVEHLLAYGADRNIKNSAGQTALDVAKFSAQGKFEVEKGWFENVIAQLSNAKASPKL